MLQQGLQDDDNAPMPEFRYEAVSPLGVEVEATTFSSDPETVIADLQARGYEVHRVEEVDEVSYLTASERPPRRPRHSPPPTAPREIPDIRFSFANPGTFLIGFGALFGGIGLLVGSIQLIAAIAGNEPGLFIGAGIGLLFAAIGGTFAYFGVRNRLRNRRVLELGTTAEGTITGTGRDPTMHVNGRNPFKMTYRFLTPNGVEATGWVRTFNEAITEYVDGEPIWVVYDPTRPKHNALWPPL